MANRHERRAQQAIDRAPDKANGGPIYRYTMTAKQERKKFRVKKGKKK